MGTISQVGFAAFGTIDVASNPSNSNGTSFSASGTINTKGAWTQLIASTANVIDLLYVYIQENNSLPWLIDIGIGGAGSEVVLIPNLTLGGQDRGSEFRILVPLHVPKGSRLAVRYQAGTITQSFVINVQGFGANQRGFTGVDDIGTALATSTGTQINVAGGGNTFGSYTTMSASTTRDYVGLFVCNSVTSGGGGTYMFDVAVGSAGNEQIVLINAVFNGDNTCLSGYTFVPVAIPAGSRLSMRQSTSNNGPPSPFYIIYGVF